MPITVPVLGDNTSPYSAVALGLGIEILSGRLDWFRKSPEIDRFVSEFAKKHPNFKPVHWETLKAWLAYYNNPRDLELLLAPVLVALNEQLVNESKEQGAEAKPLVGWDSLKKLAEFLHIQLVINGEDRSNAGPNAVSLFERNGIWGLSYDEANAKNLKQINAPQKLSLTVDEAFASNVQIHSPASFTFEQVPTDVNNPGGGDCAFYAFAIGLINHIQTEGTIEPRTFTRWIDLDPSIVTLFERIHRFDFNYPDTSLLYLLQNSLRGILFAGKIEKMKESCSSLKRLHDDKANDPEYFRYVVGNRTFSNNFATLYYGQRNEQELDPFDANHNLLAGSQVITDKALELRQSISKVLVEERKKPNFTYAQEQSLERLLLVNAFVQLLYGKGVDMRMVDGTTEIDPNSPILEALQVTKRESLNSQNDNVYYGTLDDLNILSEIFEVNLKYLQNTQEPFPLIEDPSRRTITVHHRPNAIPALEHWTTVITDSKLTTKGLWQRTKDNLVNMVKYAINLPLGYLPTSPTRAAGAQVTVEKTVPIASKEPVLNPTVKPIKNQHTAPMQQTTVTNVTVQLKDKVNKTTASYIDYNKSVWYSIFHRHGEAGRIRAQAFARNLTKLGNDDEALPVINEEILSFLSDSNNGNTNPHSYRTMLLHSLLEIENAGTISLQEVSHNYDSYLTILAENMHAEPKTSAQPSKP